MFKKHLKKLVDGVDGGVAALLMGFDGIAVDSFAREPAPGKSAADGKLDIQAVGMEFSFILTQVRKAAESLGAGAVEEMTIRTGSMLLLVRVLTPEYFIALAIAPDGNFGKGRYLLRIGAPQFLAEL